MPKRPSLTDITSLTNSSAINTLNQNWDNIQSAFDNTLSLDGSTPNAMNADLDLNGNALLNVGTIDASNLTLDGQIVTDIASVPEWRGAWATSTSYAKNDLVKTAGNVYICLIGHTSAASFITDLTAVRWELMVSKGDSGAGTGDLVSTNNLSDVSNTGTARANLGLGLVAVENVTPISKGGTGATDAPTARTNLGLVIGADVQAFSAMLNTVAALADPNADRGLFWDDSAGAYAFLEYGAGLSVSGTTLTAGATRIAGVALSGASTTLTTAIPSTANRIEVGFVAVSTNGTAEPLIRVGAGSILTTGYDGASYMAAIGNQTSTDGFTIFPGTSAGTTYTGSLTLIRVSDTLWIANGMCKRDSDGVMVLFGGTISVTGGINRVAMNGDGDTFDGGTGYVSWSH